MMVVSCSFENTEDERLCELNCSLRNLGNKELVPHSEYYD